MCDLDIPAFSYFEQNNPYTGSLRADFRFRVAQKDDMLSAAVWHQDICFEMADDKVEQSFPLTEEGLQAAVEWISAAV